MKQLFLLGVLLLACLCVLSAQQGAISGTVLDENTGEPLIGANVVIQGTSIGTSTDFDGKYQFQAEPGTYTLDVSYIGYNSKTIEGVVFSADSTTYLDLTLSDEAIELGVEIVVQAKALERSENAVLMLQKRSDKIQDGISSQEISRLGAGDAAGALEKVTGTTVVDGKYVFVRGLGDRYSASQLNGIRLPSIDPYRNSAQLDLIPANLLDNIIASKTFTPDLPGDFTGGSVNIKTKSLPERFTWNVSVSGEYNEQGNLLDDFLTFEAGDAAAFGFNDGFLDEPALLQDPEVNRALTRNAIIFDAPTNPEVARNVDQAIRSLNNQFDFDTKNTPINYSIAANIGNQFDLGGTPLGVLLAVNYSRNFFQYQNATRANFINIGAGEEILQNNFDLTDNLSRETPTIGGLFGLSLKPSNNNEINFNILYSHSTDIESRFLDGQYLDFSIIDPNSFQSRTLAFTERELLDYILSGEHVLPSLGNIKIEWAASYIESSQDEPDLRFFANTFFPNQERSTVDPSSYDEPGHFFRGLDDQTIQGKLDITIPFLQSANNANKLKFGGYYNSKERDFFERIYLTSNRSGDPFTGDIDAFYADDNIGIIGEQNNGNSIIGVHLIDQSRDQNSYTGETTVAAGYGMVTLQIAEPLKFIGGLRVETTDIQVQSLSADSATIDEVDLLPAANLIYSLNENTNIRASYSNTLARPNMREVAPFGSFGFIGDPIVFGNPDLVRSRINNFDLRFEIFGRPGELVAVSAFYKTFVDPIVRTFRPAGNPQFTYRNAETAELYGVELEFRRSLDFISDKLANFSIATNFAFIESQADIDSTELAIVRSVDPDFNDTRPLVGQSPFVANANLSYTNIETGWDGVIAYNFFDDRLSTTGVEGTPDIFERGRGTLDISLSKKIGNLKLTARARNLLNPDFETFSTFVDQEYTYSRFTRGVSFSFGASYGI